MSRSQPHTQPAPEQRPAQTVSLDRPARFRVLRSYAGHLEHAADAVFDTLFRLLEADLASNARLVGEPSGRFAVVQGEWWYRAEYRVRTAQTESDVDGDSMTVAAASIIEFEIVNVAARWRRAGPIAGRRVIANSPYSFQQLLSAINDELDLVGPEPS